MTLHQFKIFKAVAEHLSVTRASHELHLSQPCVSTQMKILEGEFGVPLYRKTGQGIRLTAEGLRVLRAIRPVIQQIEGLKTLFKKGGTKPAVLNVGSTQNPSVFRLPEILKAFKRTHANVNLSLRVGPSSLIQQMVLNGEVEIGVITSPSYDRNLSTEPFCHEEVVAVVSAKHPLAKKHQLNQQQLKNAPTLVRRGGRIIDELQKAGLNLNVCMECESSEAMRAAVDSGLGIGFFYRSTVESSLRSGYFRLIRIPQLEEISVASYIVNLRERVLSSNAQEFLALLRQWKAKMDKRVKRHTSTYAPSAGCAST